MIHIAFFCNFNHILNCLLNMKKAFFLFALTASVISFGQTLSNMTTSPEFYATAIRNGVINSSSENTTIGSPYLTKDFIETKISNVGTPVWTRYNIYKDEIEFKDNDKILLVPKSNSYAQLKYSNGTYLVLVNNNYYISIFQKNNDTAILKKEKVKYNAAKEAQSSYQEAKPASYTEAKAQFFVLSNNSLTEVTKENLVKIFPDKDIKGFLNNNKINLKNESDLLKLGEFIFK